MDVTEAFFASDAFTFQACFIKIAAVQTNFRAEVAHGLHLRFIDVIRGSINYNACVKKPACVSDRLAVIASGGGDQSGLLAGAVGVINPPATAGGFDIAHQVDAATYFERADRLQVL